QTEDCKRNSGAGAYSILHWRERRLRSSSLVSDGATRASPTANSSILRSLPPLGIVACVWYYR
ncbi:unnamed protein product, partial [Ectocarpus sp. 12 AP-2014]